MVVFWIAGLLHPVGPAQRIGGCHEANASILRMTHMWQRRRGNIEWFHRFRRIVSGLRKLRGEM